MLAYDMVLFVFVVNSGEYIQAVCDRNVAENISRVLYPNDNVSASASVNPTDLFLRPIVIHQLSKSLVFAVGLE